MRIVRIHEYGTPEILQFEEVPTPTPAPGEVLVQVTAIGLNFVDTQRRRGLMPTSLPFTSGGDVAGTVVQLGEGVTTVKEGTTVLAAVQQGAYAEYVTVPVYSLFPYPGNLEPTQAVALPIQGQTAYHIIKTAGRLQTGESILIHAAAGGVGSLAVQLARAMGAGQIIVTAGSAQKLELARSLGADVGINYRDGDWPQQVRDATRGKGVDLILEMVGGDIFSHSVSLLAPFGRLVFFGSASNEERSVLPTQFMGLQSLIGFAMPYLLKARPDLVREGRTQLINYVISGSVKPVVKYVLPFEQIAEAHRLLETRESIGKVVLQFHA